MTADLSQDIRDRTFRFACAVSSVVVSLDTEYKLRSTVDRTCMVRVIRSLESSERSSSARSGGC